MQTQDRLTALDLRALSDAEHAALRQAAITSNMSLSAYIANVITDKSRRMLEAHTANQSFETSEA